MFCLWVWTHFYMLFESLITRHCSKGPFREAPQENPRDLENPKTKGPRDPTPRRSSIICTPMRISSFYSRLLNTSFFQLWCRGSGFPSLPPGSGFPARSEAKGISGPVPKKVKEKKYKAIWKKGGLPTVQIKCNLYLFGDELKGESGVLPPGIKT